MKVIKSNGTRTHEFEVGIDLIELDIDWTYYFDAGRTNCKPEDAYPPEEEMSLSLPKGWEQTIIDHYMAGARQAIKDIEDQMMDLEFDRAPAEWAAERDEY